MTTPRILVVEDNPDLRVEIVDYLLFSQYRARGVGNVQDMHQALGNEPWDMLLLDITLPDGDGLNVARELRKTYGLQLGIIMVTARGQVEDRIDGISAGADAYLIKPINLRELKVIIDHLDMRLQKSAASHAESWTLDATSLELTCPNGERVVLTVTESLLLKTLLETPGQAVSRELLCDCLPPGSLHEDTRRLDSILSRLRSKAKKDTGMNLPIHTLRNKGYTFAHQAEGD